MAEQPAPRATFAVAVRMRWTYKPLWRSGKVEVGEAGEVATTHVVLVVLPLVT